MSSFEGAAATVESVSVHRWPGSGDEIDLAVLVLSHQRLPGAPDTLFIVQLITRLQLASASMLNVYPSVLPLLF